LTLTGLGTGLAAEASVLAFIIGPQRWDAMSCQWSRKELTRGTPQPPRQREDGFQRGVSFAALDAAYVVAVKPRTIGKLFLAKLRFNAQAPDGEAKVDEICVLHGRERCEERLRALHMMSVIFTLFVCRSLRAANG
jgi:hypothetical protein